MTISVTPSKRYLTITLSLIGAFLIAAPALATTEKAQELRGIIDRMIENNKAESNEHFTIQYRGETSIEDAGSYYAVTLPHAFIESSSDIIDIGIVAINASPHTAAGQWKMSIATPTPIVSRDKKNGEMLKLHIGTQKAAGLWDDASQSFLKFLGEYNDIRIEDSVNEVQGTLSKVHISNNFDIANDGAMSGKSLMKTDNLALELIDNKANDKTNIQIGSAHLSLDMRGINRNGFKTSLEDLAMPASEDGTAPPPKDITEIVTDMIGFLGDGMSGTYEINDLNVQKTPINASEGETPDPFKIKTGQFGFDMSGFQQDKAALGVTFNYAMETPKADEPLAPSFLNLDFKLSDIPLKQLIQMNNNALSNDALTPEMAQFARMGLLLKVPALLGQNASKISFNKNKLGNDLYEVHLDGNFRADANALKAAIGEFDLAIHGYDNLRKEADKIATTNPTQANNIRSRIAWLERYILYADISTDSKGRTLHKFKIALNAQGVITINGQDTSKPAGDIKIEPAQ